MTAPHSMPGRRQWADVAIILVGVILLGLAVWGGPILTMADDEVRNPTALWLVFASAGGLSIAGVLLAQRWSRRGLARVLVVLAALILVGSVIAFRYFSWQAVLTTVVPAAILVVAANYLGPIPPPT